MDKLEQLVISSTGRGKINQLSQKKNWLGSLIKQEELSSFKEAQEWAYARFYRNPSKATEYIDLFKRWFRVNDFSNAKSIEELCAIEISLRNKKLYLK